MWRRSGLLLLRFVDGATAGDRLRTAAHVQRKRVTKTKARRAKEGTNPYNKAQYINAFVEAQSARMMRERRLQEGAAVEQSLLVTVDAARVDAASRQPQQLVQLGASPQPVAFGAWREGLPAVERACTAMDRNLHCIVRGATTPPAFAPEALRRGVPVRDARVRQLIEHLHHDERGGRWPAPKMHVFTGNLDVCVKAACGGDAAITRRLLALLLHTAAERNWSLALQLYHECVLPYQQQQQQQWQVDDSLERAEAISMHVAVLCESIRAHTVLSGDDGACPPFHTVVSLATSSPIPLLPVAAAPIFSILQPDEGTTWRDVVALAQHFVPKDVKRMYLPSIAWGELLRAVRRMGASLEEVQSVVDTITDPKRTKHAERHMCDSNVWNAYLAASDWQHALDVFAKNWPHYGVKETAATTAALMESLLRDKQWKRALDTFHRLQKKEGHLIIGTSGVFSVVFRALAQQGDWHAVTSLLLDYDRFLVHFGVSHEWWLASPLRAEAKSPQPRSDERLHEWMTFASELRSRGHATCELVDAIQHALIACDALRQQQEQEQQPHSTKAVAGADVPDGIVTAEMLHELL